MVVKELEKLKNEKNAVILAHNYQEMEVQRIADFVGDSLELSLKSMNLDADIIVFAGVWFMAEQAKILNPTKKVLIPNRGAICSLAYMVLESQIRDIKSKYPDAPLLVYVNSPARIKALADYVVTSANAIEVAKKVDSNTILFAPDANLASFVAKKTGKKVIAVPPTGHCYVHLLITPTDIEEAKSLYPNGVVMVHPEVPPESQELADFVGGTGAMIRFVGSSDAELFLVGTEVGMINRLSRDYPDKKFVPVVPQARCIGMKKITVEGILRSLRDGVYEVTVPEDVARLARKSIIRTFEFLGVNI